MGTEQYYLICAYVLSALIGLCVGSFLNVVIYRLPNGMSLSKPASHCTKCDYTLQWYDNIPVLSYLILGGKCRKCGERISPRYMIVELLNAVLWVLSVHLFWNDNPVYAVISAIVMSTLICIFFIDFDCLLIYNRFLVILGVLGVVSIFYDKYAYWYDHLIGAVAFGGFFLLVYYGALLILKREGMGFGDVKFALAAGLLLGWQKMLLALLVSSVSASIILVIIKRVKGDEDGHEYPFGPFISIGVATAMLVGEPIITWYLSLLGL